jgi:excisionase family DNA binding protein
MHEKLLLTPEEVGRLLSIGRSQVYKLLMQGELRSLKIGASRRIPVTAVNDYVQRLMGTPDERLSA